VRFNLPAHDEMMCASDKVWRYVDCCVDIGCVPSCSNMYGHASIHERALAPAQHGGADRNYLSGANRQTWENIIHEVEPGDIGIYGMSRRRYERQFTHW
jgi:hypothetical protein